MKLFLLALLGVLAAPAQAGVFFQDNFNAQSSSWNIGVGAPDTPAGQEGTWGFWDRDTCAAFSCTNCASLPSQANGWLLFIDPTGGPDGSKAMRWDQNRGCTNGFPGTLVYTFASARKEFYIGISLRIENGLIKEVGNPSPPNPPQNVGCKIPYRFFYQNQEQLYIQLPGGDPPGGLFSNTDLEVNDPQANFNGGSWWDAGITPADYYNDHAFHWIEFHFKLNSTGGSSDGVVEAWVDGNARNSATGVKFTTTTQGMDKIWLEIGNCSDTLWVNTTFKSIWIDNFTMSTTYIGPPNSGPGAPAHFRRKGQP